jgi:hypothetical protein
MLSVDITEQRFVFQGRQNYNKRVAKEGEDVEGCY